MEKNSSFKKIVLFFSFTTQIFLISNLVLADDSENSDDLEYGWLGGIGDKIFSLFETQHEAENRQREELVDRIAGEDGQLSREELQILREYDAEQEREDIESSLGMLNSINTSNMSMIERYAQADEEKAEEQVAALDQITANIVELIDSGEMLSARLAVEKIVWIPIGNDRLDNEYRRMYQNTRARIEEAIQD
jgi:hypothetical protein